jgi:acetolactate synthase-1/2/3 large subunit
MNGAESLVRTLAGAGVEVCFSNPGTSEMHFVAALDTVPGIRCVLCLFEGVATGAADGYARMTGKPAATLLHLGPGLGNGHANLHNARKAHSPIVNIVGEHATYHRQYDPPLGSDIETLAKPVSGWIRTTTDARRVGADAADAVAAAMTPPGRIATLILPADTAWNDGGIVGRVPTFPKRPPVSDAAVAAAAKALHGSNTTLLINGVALLEPGTELAGAIGARTGVRVLAQGPNARVTRGAGRVAIDRVPNPIDPAVATFKDTRRVILAGATQPVAGFAYPGKPSLVTPLGCEIITLALPEDDVIGALAALADAVGADPRMAPRQALSRPELPTGGITLDKLAAALGALLPENAIISDESVTTGRSFFAATLGASPHDWLQLTGGAIGSGIPMAIGAAVACPDRKVINLESDGSGMYTVQGLWTQAREKLDVLTVIWSNRSYNILRQELKNVRAGEPGRTALDMLSLADPELDWVSMANGLGVEGVRVSTIDEFSDAFRGGVKRRGPFLIEVMI